MAGAPCSEPSLPCFPPGLLPISLPKENLTPPRMPGRNGARRRRNAPEPRGSVVNALSDAANRRFQNAKDVSFC